MQLSALKKQLVSIGQSAAAIDTNLKSATKDLRWTTQKLNQASLRSHSKVARSRFASVPPTVKDVNQTAHDISVGLTENQRQIRRLTKLLSSARDPRERELLLRQIAVLTEDSRTWSSVLKDFVRENSKYIVVAVAAAVLSTAIGHALGAFTPIVTVAKDAVQVVKDVAPLAINAANQQAQYNFLHTALGIISTIVTVGLPVALQVWKGA
jgi:hypothetical protein